MNSPIIELVLGNVDEEVSEILLPNAIITHPLYDSGDKAFDFSMIILEQHAKLTHFVNPVCLPQMCFSEEQWLNSSLLNGIDGCQQGVVSGWGAGRG